MNSNEFDQRRGRGWGRGCRPEGAEATHIFGPHGRGGGGFSGGRGRDHEGRGGRGGRGGGLGYGGLRLVLLKLIAEKPSHGYELIKAIEERFDGGYAPSPGIVYPALSWLEDGGFISISPDADNRKTATITEAGIAHLAEKEAEITAMFEAMKTGKSRGAEFAPIMRAMDNLKGALRNRTMRPLEKEALELIVDLIDEVAKKIERS